MEDSGFTLMEVLVALAILSLALPALYKSMSLSYRAVSASAFKMDALSFARSRLEEARDQDLTDGGNKEGRLANGLSWQLSIQPVSQDNNGKRPYRVAVEVDDALGRRVVRLETIKLFGQPQ